ncbi:hypothetical protein SESBI_05639 [Sesbania bispinosa]|nr:hypothetical protein SESBI_05639 [Sesbania bispinosa]
MRRAEAVERLGGCTERQIQWLDARLQRGDASDVYGKKGSENGSRGGKERELLWTPLQGWSNENNQQILVSITSLK